MHGGWGKYCCRWENIQGNMTTVMRIQALVQLQVLVTLKQLNEVAEISTRTDAFVIA